MLVPLSVFEKKINVIFSVRWDDTALPVTSKGI